MISLSWLLTEDNLANEAVVDRNGLDRSQTATTVDWVLNDLAQPAVALFNPSAELVDAAEVADWRMGFD